MVYTKTLSPSTQLNEAYQNSGSRNYAPYQSGNTSGAYRELDELYRGRGDRFRNYDLYDLMDGDTDVSRALDIIAEHCTQRNSEQRIFDFDWYDDNVSSELSKILKHVIDNWIRMNKLDRRSFSIVRNTIKYGDWFQFRDPDNFKLFDIHPKDILGAYVEPETLEVKGWIVQNFRFTDSKLFVNDINANQAAAMVGGTTNSSTKLKRSVRVVDASHIIHYSTSDLDAATTDGNEGLASHTDNPWPFAKSWLDGLYRTFQQRDKLEQASLLHRLHRAPSRLVWFLDTGRARPDRANFMVNKFKQELNQKRMPKDQSGNVRTDAVFNPMGQLEDYIIPVAMDQRGSKVQPIEGQSWTDIPELDVYNKKLAQGLRVPYAWLLPSGDGGITPSDGRMGQATQEEIEFSRFCARLQRFLDPLFDREYKRYAEWRGVSANWGDFDIHLTPPTDYEASRNRARLRDAADAYQTLAGEKTLSRRFLMKYVLGLTDDMVAENERMLLEETGGASTGGGSVSDVMGGGMVDGDMGGMGDIEMDVPSEIGDDIEMGDMDDVDMGGDIDMDEPTNESVLESMILPDPKETDTSRRTPMSLRQDKSFNDKNRISVSLKMLRKLAQAQFNKQVRAHRRNKYLPDVYGGGGGDDEPTF